MFLERGSLPVESTRRTGRAEQRRAAVHTRGSPEQLCPALNCSAAALVPRLQRWRRSSPACEGASVSGSGPVCVGTCCACRSSRRALSRARRHRSHFLPISLRRAVATAP